MSPLAFNVNRTSDPEGGESLAILVDGQALTFADVLTGWRETPAVRAATLRGLAETRYTAFFWELPPLRSSMLDEPFECMVIDSLALARTKPNKAAFEMHLRDARAPNVAFDNLGRDAHLVVPTSLAAPEVYGHIAAFVRAAPEAQRHDLLRKLGEIIPARLSASPLWISTSGLGVPWLHVRLDQRPKYYQCRRYRRM